MSRVCALLIALFRTIFLPTGRRSDPSESCFGTPMLTMRFSREQKAGRKKSVPAS